MRVQTATADFTLIVAYPPPPGVAGSASEKAALATAPVGSGLRLFVPVALGPPHWLGPQLGFGRVVGGGRGHPPRCWILAENSAERGGRPLRRDVGGAAHGSADYVLYARRSDVFRAGARELYRPLRAPLVGDGQRDGLPSRLAQRTSLAADTEQSASGPCAGCAAASVATPVAAASLEADLVLRQACGGFAARDAAGGLSARPRAGDAREAGGVGGGVAVAGG